MTLEAAFDELIAMYELRAFCDNYIAEQQRVASNQMIKELAIALGGDLAQP